MIKARVGFVVYGVHKDALPDPSGDPFIDESVIARSKDALKRSGLEIVENEYDPPIGLPVGRQSVLAYERVLQKKFTPRAGELEIHAG